MNLYTVPADASAAITAGGAGATPVTVTNTTPGQNMKLTFTAGSNQKVSIKMTNVSIGSNPIAGTTVTLMKGSTRSAFRPSWARTAATSTRPSPP